jgi:hypothetical protein
VATRITIGPPGSKLDWDNWGKPVTDLLNEHDDRIVVLEAQQTSAQLAWTQNGTMATSTGVEAAMAGWTGGASPTFLFKNGWVYSAVVQVGVTDTGTAFQAGRVDVRMRKGFTTGGQQLGHAYCMTRGGDSVVDTQFIRFIKNISGADVNTQIGMTVQLGAGGNAKIFGDVSSPFTLSVTPLGLTTVLTNHASIAVAIT